MKPSTAALPVRSFRSQDAWETWLEKNHASANGILLKFAKKDSGKVSITYLEAVEIALCFGWIDGQSRSVDENHWVQRFTPRRARSKWSQINCGRALRLIEAGRMRPAGLKEVEAARKDGRWDAAYASPRNSTVPDDLQAALAKRPRALANFAKLDSKNRYALLYRVQDARKPETRARRIQAFVEMLLRGETIH